MPQRIPTPPTDNTTSYFTAVYPFPLNGHWEVKEDQKVFSRWLACFVPKECLIAILHKPTARGMVLIEIDRAFTEHQKLLGLHEWSKFLKQPTAEEKGRSTQIFYSTYKTHRAAQKDGVIYTGLDVQNLCITDSNRTGWKTINIADSWFDEPASRIRFPYPRTSWCPPPLEDKTNKKMCHPLPVIHFPTPEKAAKPVVGSGAYYENISSPSPYSAEVQSANWNQVPIQPTKRNASTATPIVPARAAVSAPSVSRPKPNAWGAQKPASALFPTLVTTPTSKPVAALASTKPPQGVWGARSATSTSKPQNPAGRSDTRPGAPPGLVRSVNANSGNSLSSTSSSELDWASEVAAAIAINNNDQYEQLISGVDDLTVSDGLDKALQGDDDDEVFEVPPLSSGAAYAIKQEEVKENLWSDYKPPGAKDDEELCPVHGVSCSRGICQFAAKAEKEKKKKERESTRGHGRGRGKGRGSSRDRTANTAGSDEGPRLSPANSNPVSRASSQMGMVSEPNFNHDDETDLWDD
ncbi:hypothetical protein D9757_006112 [Collybiopsis confluens]|uniref:Uncharacterized protein n=1 Tax=Collybiopsis confluens TaxID=2823264 RepID=A0A8H5M7F5_9AGAR|nr:hypothetical protein D9757_006112 [Collybiopsis confluens]